MRTRKFLNFNVLHPFLVTLYPVFSLWLTNADQLELFTIIRPMLYALAVSLITVLAGLLLFRRFDKAALFASCFLILFFSYGHVFGLLDMKQILGIVVGRHRFMIPLWLILFGTITVIIWKAKTGIASINRIFNVVSLFLVGILFAQIVLFQVQTRRIPAQEAPVDQVMPANPPAAGRAYRDIYYIVLDGYAREDILAEQHGIDIHPFIQELRDLGFQVMDCGQSNYTSTPFSIASTLNMNYLDALGVSFDQSEKRVAYYDFTQLIGHSLIRKKLTAYGYRFESFKPLYPWMDIPDSDDYFDVEKTSSFYDKQESIEFHYLFLRTTAMRVMIESEEYSPDIFNRMPPFIVQVLNPKARLLSTRNLKQHDQNLYALKTLSNAAQLPGPKFFYAHLFITHPPYMFQPDGSLRWPVRQDQKAYDDQILFVNRQLVNVFKQIIAESQVPPLIILQADHGYHASFEPDRVKILSAFYLPDGGADHLYPTFTPVNTFRLILNQYFNENHPFLEDKSYFSPLDTPYQFEPVPNHCPDEPR